MLFDLRSRKRRGAVRVIYIFLALTMVVGLVGLGIGTGNTGGLLNAGSNNGPGGNGHSLSTQQVKNAIKAVNAHPTAANWAALITAHYAAAGSGYNTATGVYTAAAKAQLQKAANAYEQYVKLSGTPSLNNSILGARIYQTLGQWSNETQAWNYAAQGASGAERRKPYYCLALAAYAAKQTAKGNLAAAQAVALIPKLQRLTQRSVFQQAKSSPTAAQQLLVQYC